MRVAGVVTVLVLALGAFAGSASANIMVWQASVAGTYSSDATTTNQECGADYKTPMTVSSSETGTLKTNKATLFDAWRAGSKPELAIHNDMKPLKLAGTKTRTSGLDLRDEPNGCTSPPRTLDCSTKSYSSYGTLYGRPVGRKLQASLGLDMNGVFNLQGGEWQRCPLAMGQGALPYWTNPKDTAEGLLASVFVPVTKLFAKHPRPFQVKGTLARSGGETSGPAKSTWSYRFDFTLKFKFVRRG
jgi:hypothetical protein